MKLLRKEMVIGGSKQEFSPHGVVEGLFQKFDALVVTGDPVQIGLQGIGGEPVHVLDVPGSAEIEPSQAGAQQRRLEHRLLLCDNLRPGAVLSIVEVAREDAVVELDDAVGQLVGPGGEGPLQLLLLLSGRQALLLQLREQLEAPFPRQSVGFALKSFQVIGKSDVFYEGFALGCYLGDDFFPDFENPFNERLLG